MAFFDNVPSVTKNIIIINVLVFAATYVPSWHNWMYETLSLFCPGSPFFHWWQPITHMFMHGGVWHIFFNMYTLFFFGCVLERAWGPKKFLIFYFVTGLGAALLHTGVQLCEAHHYLTVMHGFDSAAANSASASLHQLYMTPTVGASGAIYGVLMGYAMLYPESRLTLLFPPITLKAKWFIIIFAVIELFTGVFGMGGGIAHFAHLGGMLFGFLLIIYWKRRHKLYSYADWSDKI